MHIALQTNILFFSNHTYAKGFDTFSIIETWLTKHIFDGWKDSSGNSNLLA